MNYQLVFKFSLSYPVWKSLFSVFGTNRPLAREPKIYVKFLPVHFCWWSQVECHAADAT